MVQEGRDRLGHLANVRFHHGNGYDLASFEDGSFDVVYSIVALQHMPRTVAYNYLLESHRVLRQGGVLWLYVPNLLRDDCFSAFHHFSQPWFVSHPYPMNFYTPQELSRLLVAAGFWLERLNDELRAEARKTGGPGISEQAQPLVGLHDAERQRLARHNAELTQRNAELERALERIRSNPLVRLAPQPVGSCAGQHPAPTSSERRGAAYRRAAAPCPSDSGYARAASPPGQGPGKVAKCPSWSPGALSRRHTRAACYLRPGPARPWYELDNLDFAGVLRRFACEPSGKVQPRGGAIGKPRSPLGGQPCRSTAGQHAATVTSHLPVPPQRVR